MSIEKMMCLSTGHIQQATAEQIDLGMAMSAIEDPNERDHEVPTWMQMLPIYPHGEYGWLFCIGGAADDHTVRAYMPHEFLAILDWAYENKCDWLLLDRDADLIDQLPKFDW